MNELTFTFTYTQLQLEASVGLLVNHNIARLIRSYGAKAALWPVTIMMAEAQECLQPVILYLAAACLARLCSVEITEPLPGCAMHEDESKPLHSHLPENFPDAPDILDTCLQNIYEVNDAASLLCNHQTLQSYTSKHLSTALQPRGAQSQSLQ